MDDRALDEFTENEAESDPAGSEEHIESPTERPETVEPAAGTARWSDEGDTCRSCGERVSRLWFEDGETVCFSCKEW